MQPNETEPSSAPRSRRQVKNILINPRYQLRYALGFFVIGLVLVSGLCVVFYSYIRENYDLMVDLGPLRADLKAQLYRELDQLITVILAASAIFLALVSLMSLWITHRTAGVIYHFERVFRAIRDGDRSARVFLRPSDDFKGSATLFNEMMDQVLKVSQADAPPKVNEKP
jgi:methyl-accepting chemotaxis protein